MSILHLFFAIIGVLVISIIIVVISLVFHMKISSLINNLEKEIEKKTLEYDALKKERASGHASANRDPPPDMSTKVFELPISQENEMLAEVHPVEEGSIQIVRNVRGTFQTTDTVMQNHGVSEQPVKKATHVPFAAPPFKAPSVPLQPKQPEPADFVIPVFSQTTANPDFNRLYQTLIERLKTSADPAITFDFSGIESLNNGELEYLEKIYLFLVNQHRSLTFHNCSATLSALLRHNPKIASLIR